MAPAVRGVCAFAVFFSVSRLFLWIHSCLGMTLRFVSEDTRGKANMTPVKRIYLLYLQTVLIIAGPSVTIYNASKQHVHGKRHILSLKSNSWRLKNISCNRNTSTWQIIEVSNSTKRHADNSGNQADL